MIENATKLGPSLKILLFDDTIDDIDRLNLFVQITSTPNSVIRDQLSDLGAEIRAEAGDVLTITLPVDHLQTLAAFDFVVYIELSRPLSTEE